MGRGRVLVRLVRLAVVWGAVATFVFAVVAYSSRDWLASTASTGAAEFRRLSNESVYVPTEAEILAEHAAATDALWGAPQMENATDNATCADNATCVSTKDSDFEWAKSLHKRVEGIEFDALKNALHAARGAQRAVDARRDAEHLSAAALSALAAQLGDLVVGLGASLGLAGGAAEDLLEDSIVNRASLAALHAVTWDDVQRLNATALADADARERSRSAVERFVGEAARKEETARSERLATLLRSHTERHLAFDDDHRLNASAVLRAVERNFKVWWVRRGLDAGCVAFERDPLALIAARLEDAALRLKAWCAALPFSDLASERVAAAYASANAYASGACGVDVGEQVWQVTQEVSIVFSRLAAAAGLYEALSAAARALLVQPETASQKRRCGRVWVHCCWGRTVVLRIGTRGSTAAGVMVVLCSGTRVRYSRWPLRPAALERVLDAAR